MTRVITFLSDYGLADEFVGVVHAVIARLAPESRVIDIGHGIARQDVMAGALALERALPYAPPGVHLAVVDPEVGARRRAVALRTAGEDRLLVGPDNGLLLPAAERFGGVAEAMEVSSSPWRLEPVSATFHGRDVFAPVAARLAAGAPLAEAGVPMDPADLVRLDRPAPHSEPGRIAATATGADAFGNIALAAGPSELAAAGLRLGQPVAVRAGGRRLLGVLARTFADAAPRQLLVYEDAGGTLAVAVNGGDAAALLGVRAGDEIGIEGA